MTKINSGFFKLLRALSVLIFFLIVLGGTVRNLGAGLACPDWPLCFGRLLPHFNLEIFSEFFHRLVAGTVSLIFLGAGIYTFSKKPLRALLGRLVFLGFILLAAQVVLGGLTVLKLLQSDIVTLHLTTGTLFFAVVIIMTLRFNRFGDQITETQVLRDRKRKEPSNTWRWAIAALTTLFIQIIFGGVVSSHHAGLACSNYFPKCLGVWWPDSGLAGIVGVQLVHRFGAVIAFSTIVTFALMVERNKKLARHIIVKARVIFALVILQVLLGIGNVIYSLPVTVSVGHLAVAEALFALILIETYEIRHFELR